ncbi:hypothetical protein, partial [Frankia tisae]|uniref:hypothetical protein n=1 Tax=Frankia tisae TaxID=2950104 RepID=UPI0021BF1591
LPARIRDQAGQLLDAHRARTASHRNTLLRPGGVELDAVTYGDGTRSRGPAAVEALTNIGHWWVETIALAERLIALDPEHADTLALAAGTELSQVLRARTIVLGEVAADVVGSQAATGPQIGDDGKVLVAGTRVPLTGVVAAGPPPRAPEVHLSISAGAAVADVVAHIRQIADQIEVSGAYS